MATPSQPRCVFVGNIPYDATEEQLIQICEEVGPVVSFRLVIDRETGKPKGYGFCEYKDEETALSARRNLQGYVINGRQLRVDFAENDKGGDRNREQSRGGPGLASNVGAPAVIGDSSLYQPIGLQFAATAASVMAGSLGSSQTDAISLKQNGLQGQSSLGNDRLTHYLSNMSRKQLYDVISDMKVMATTNRELARQLLQMSPMLPKALFQAEIMLGMVTPQMLQMPNLRQAAGSISQPLQQDGVHSQKSSSLPPHPGHASFTPNKMQFSVTSNVQESQLPTFPQNTLGSNLPSGLQFQQGMPPRFQQPPQAHNPLMLHSTAPGQSGGLAVPAVRPFSGLPVRPPTSLDNSVLKQQMQHSLLQNHGSIGSANLGNNATSIPPNATSQHSLLSRPVSSHPSFQQVGSSNSVTLLGARDPVNKLAEPSARLTDDHSWVSKSNMSDLPLRLSERTGLRGSSVDPSDHPSKLVRLDDRHGTLNASIQGITGASRPVPTTVLETGSSLINRIPNAEAAQHSDKQSPQLQIAPEVESALLQQVMSLTAEQLSSLPPEQRQQVLQLQQMLR
ncbi:hypothetical protein Syun_013705 [Stephania yunnanensis]|uniref:RRM domain-containing protein n=1 Tax=Stephania yunnanensis TaxID=152371 RepID=A0AAP0JIQ0_9MAGN